MPSKKPKKVTTKKPPKKKTEGPTLTAAQKRFDEPWDLSDAETAFPARALQWMPERALIPSYPDKKNYEELIEYIFMFGGKKFNLQPRNEKWDKAMMEKAWNHLDAILRSFSPKHEHKVEGVAYLASRWFSFMHLECEIAGKPVTKEVGKERKSHGKT